MSEQSRFSFTKSRLAALEPPAQGRVYHYDLGMDNLALCVTSAGSKVFYRIGRINGAPVRMKIGPFGALSVEQARTACKKLTGQIADGRDPHAERKATKAQPTLQDLFEHWMTHARAHKKPRSVKEDDRQYHFFLDDLKNRRLATITKSELQAKHVKIGKDKPYQANRMLALIRAMFNKADSIGFDGPNPTRGIKKFKERSRDRFLLPDEVPLFFQALQSESQLFQDFFMVCLLSGARRSNVASMAWPDLHLESALWRIPDSKNGLPLMVHLPVKAVEILKRRREEANGSPWVFPGGRKNPGGHLEDPKGAWKRVRSASGLGDLRLHDLRRTLGSWQAIAGTSLAIIGKSLGHKSQQATSVYARLTHEPVVKSVNAATDAILEAAGRQS
jgi:integrase